MLGMFGTELEPRWRSSNQPGHPSADVSAQRRATLSRRCGLCLWLPGLSCLDAINVYKKAAPRGLKKSLYVVAVIFP